jgi:low molecular weight phosphotyrosine protein phosphatase
MAEGVFRSLSSSQQHSILIDEIDSAGTGAYHVHDPPDHRTMATLRQHGIKNYNHAARKVTKEDFRTFDYILAMDQYNLRDLLRLRDSIIHGGQSGRTKGRITVNSLGTKSNAGETSTAKVAEVRLFGDFNSDGTLNKQIGGGQEIEDPYYGGINGFEIAYEQALKFSKGFLAYLEKQIEQ